MLLAHLIREEFGLTGTHVGCDTTSCGACTVLLDGRPIKSCTMFGVQADGREVTTVEGLLQDGQLHPIQAAFKEEHGLQCGFCTPGMMLTGSALLAENPSPSEDEVRWAISGNICRCTGYMNIVKAIQAAGRDLAATAEAAAPTSPWRARGIRTWHPRSKRSEGSVTASGAWRTTASSAATATTSTTSTCPGCCTWRSCAARTPTRS